MLLHPLTPVQRHFQGLVSNDRRESTESSINGPLTLYREKPGHALPTHQGENVPRPVSCLLPAQGDLELNVRVALGKCKSSPHKEIKLPTH